MCTGKLLCVHQGVLHCSMTNKCHNGARKIAVQRKLEQAEPEGASIIRAMALEAQLEMALSSKAVAKKTWIYKQLFSF